MENNIKNVKQFELWYAELPEIYIDGEKSHVQQGVRPVVVVSGYGNNAHSPNCTVLTVTKQDKRNLPCHVRIEDNYKKYGLKMPSTIMGENPAHIDKRQLKYKIGEITEKEMKEKVFKAMAAHYGMAV